MIKTWPREKLEEDCKSANSCKLMKFLIDTNNDNDDGSYQYVMDFALHELQSRLEQAEKDAARIDWMEKTGRVNIDRAREGRIDGPIRWDVEYGHNDKEARSKKCLRAAIDAAMQSAKESQ